MPRGAKVKREKVLKPEDIGLVYSHDRQALGVVLAGAVFYSDGETQLGLGNQFPVGDAVSIMRKLAAAAQRHRVGKGTLISINDYAKLTRIDVKDLDHWARTEIGYLFGARVVKLGITELVYLPDNLDPALFAKHAWPVVEEKLPAKIQEYLALVEGATVGQIAYYLQFPVRRIQANLTEMHKKGVVKLTKNKYSLNR